MVDLNGEPGACEICERSMLAGERTRTYVTRDRDTREICDLCVVRAESAGWMPAELAGSSAPEGRREGGGTMRRLLSRARESTAVLSRPETATEQQDEKPPAPKAEPREEERPRRRSVPQKPERRVRRAFESFNASEHRSTVRSLIRSLGGPYVSAVTTQESPGEVRITVAWELSWYQYEVDLTAPGEPVRELGRGQELSELDKADQTWNAHAAEDGELRTGLIGSEAAG